MASDLKQVVVVRKDTVPPMRKGKVGAQCGHAVMSFLTRRMVKTDQPRVYTVTLTEEEEQWLETSYAKVVLGAETEAELMDVCRRAQEAGLETHLITDSGLTEFGGPTVTCVGIGPDRREKIDPITGHLKPL